MKKAAKLKQKMKVQEKGQICSSDLDIPEVKSSKELLKRLEMKRVGMIGNIGGTNAPVLASQGQFNLSNFEVARTNLNPENTASIAQKKLTAAQPKVPSQKKGPTLIPNSHRPILKKIVHQNDASREKLQAIERELTEASNSKSKQQPSQNQLPNKRGVAEKDQSLKRTQMEDDYSRAKKQQRKGVDVEDDESMTGQEGVIKKTKETALCRSMLIDAFLKQNEDGQNEQDGEDGEHAEEEELLYESEDEGLEINAQQEGTSKKRTRGPTACLQIHARAPEDSQEVILDDDGEPIGPTDKVVFDLSFFLGTIARNSDFCPLIYTNFKALLKDHKTRIWKYVTEKFIISDKGEKAVFSRINDAWRRYKCYVKRRHFLKYSTLKEQLKHRPLSISEAHFKQLIAYWKNTTIKRISEKNAVNRAKQKYIHRMGPRNFARVRAELRAKKEDGQVSRAEMFIETRTRRSKGQKGKPLDEETQNVISKLQDSIGNSSESVEQTFQSMFGKERSGRVRCYGRTITPSLFIKNEEIAAIKKGHSAEMSAMAKKIEDLEAIVKFVVHKQNPDLDIQDVDNMMARVLNKENSAAGPRSSASTYNPDCEQVENDDDEDDNQDYVVEEM